MRITITIDDAGKVEAVTAEPVTAIDTAEAIDAGPAPAAPGEAGAPPAVPEADESALDAGPAAIVEADQ